MKRQRDTQSKKVCEFYFDPVEGEEGKFQCKICPKTQRTQKPGTGWSNLMDHITKAHPNYELEMKKCKEGGTLDGMEKLILIVRLLNV